MKKIITVLLLVSCTILTGCWDKIELEELGYVAAIGMDIGRHGGFSITFQIQNPQVGSSQRAEAQNEPAAEIVTVESADILSAKDTVSANVARRLTFSHANALILGEEFARSSECFNFIGELLRDRELRSDINIIVSRENASEFIRNNNPPIETRPMKFYDLMSKRWLESGITPVSNIHRFLQRTEQDVALFPAIYATTKTDIDKKFGLEDAYLPGQIYMDSPNPVQMIGSAVFKEGRMIGTINGEETRLTMLLRTNIGFSGIMVVFKDPIDDKSTITARLYTIKKPRIKVEISGKVPKIDETIFVEYEIVSIPSHIDYVEDLKNQELLKNNIKKEVEKKLVKLIGRSQNEFGGDLFLWSNEARKKFRTYQGFVDYNWMGKFTSTRVSINYDIRLRGFGKELRPSNLEKIRD